MYNLDKITRKLEAGELAVGSHVAFDSPFLTEMIAGAGFDFIWIDAEHGAVSGHVHAEQRAESGHGFWQRRGC